MASLKYLWKNRARFPMHTKAFYAAWAKRILTFPNLVRRNLFRSKLIRIGATISNTAEIRACKTQGKLQHLSVGEHSLLGNCTLILHESLQIGNNVVIGEGVTIITGTHGLDDPEWKSIFKPIKIEDYVWIANDATILCGVTIGKGAVVGARAVVSKDVPPFSIVAGNPAKIINKKRIEDLKYNPCHFLAGNQAWLKG